MKKKFKLFYLLLLFWISFELSGFVLEDNTIIENNIISNNVISINNIVNDSYTYYDVLFFPNNNSEHKLFSYLINDKVYDIRCNFYDFDDYFYDNLINYSSNLSHQINLDLVVFHPNKKHFDLVKDYGDTNFNIMLKNINLTLLYLDKSRGLMHNKFCIINNDTILMGSTNPTYNGLRRNNNNFFIIDSKILAKNYLNDFNKLKNKKENLPVLNPKVNVCKGSDCFMIENYFCPDDNCESHVIDTLNDSKNNITFFTFSFTSKNIANLMILNSRNIDINGVFEKKQNGKYSVMSSLKDYANVSVDHNKYNMHNKVFIVDDKVLITGSYNPTNNGNKYNDENILIIHNENISKKYVEEYYSNIK